MAKYSYELKRTVVKEYLKGKSSVEDLALKYNIKSHTAVFNWIHAFEALGEEGLKPSRCQKHYPSDFKEFMVKSYLENEMSYQKICSRHGLKNPSLLGRWVREYREEGLIRFVSKEEERFFPMKKKDNFIKTSKQSKNTKDNKTKRELELEEENKHLRIENAFLKEWRRLRLAEARKKNESQESSIISEDPSN